MMWLNRWLALLTLSLAAPWVLAANSGDTFRDWTLRCGPVGATARPTCYIYQDLLLKHDKQPLLHMAVGYLTSANRPMVLLTLPLGVSLPAGVSVRVDNGPAKRLRYERCEANGCLAPMALSDELLRSLKAGREARVAFFDGARREISVPVSLLGFTAGFNALDKP